MRRIIPLVLLFAPLAAFAAPRTYSDLANMATNYINAAIGVCLTAAIAAYFYGIVLNYTKSSNKSFADLRKQILWGILALFVMFSVWGILNLLRNTLFGGGAGIGGSSEETVCDKLEDCMLE